jgi:hypothetical protein
MRLLAYIPLILLAGCGEATLMEAKRIAAPYLPPPPIKSYAGLDRAIGRNASELVATFGPASQDVREETARKLQFSGAACILDAYLYPPSKGREPVTTYVAARTADGRETDKMGCVNALARR